MQHAHHLVPTDDSFSLFLAVQFTVACINADRVPAAIQHQQANVLGSDN